MELRNWAGTKFSFFVWLTVALLSLFLIVYGTIHAITYELSYDQDNPTVAAITHL